MCSFKNERHKHATELSKYVWSLKDKKSSEAMIFAVINAIFCNCVEKPEKFRTSTGFEPVTSRFRCDALTN